jgi:flagellar motility protein MotE (MotC chaperone)
VPSARSRLRLALALLGALAASGAAASPGPDEAKAKAAASDKNSEVSRYCAAVAPSVAESRVVWQTKRLNELDGEIKQRLAALEKAEAAAREWVEKREALMKSASDDIVAIYSKMSPESAANQIGAMDDDIAVAILARLKPQAAGAILDQMEAARASKLAAGLSGLSRDEKKS